MESATTKGVSLYTRQATGLVREIGVSSNLALNISFISLPLAVLVATQAPYAFPGSNLIGIVIITALLCVIPTLLYGSLSQAMPRSGGDYVFVSRIIHPVIGFAANFSVDDVVPAGDRLLRLAAGAIRDLGRPVRRWARRPRTRRSSMLPPRSRPRSGQFAHRRRCADPHRAFS